MTHSSTGIFLCSSSLLGSRQKDCSKSLLKGARPLPKGVLKYLIDKSHPVSTSVTFIKFIVSYCVTSSRYRFAFTSTQGGRNDTQRHSPCVLCVSFLCPQVNPPRGLGASSHDSGSHSTNVEEGLEGGSHVGR